MVSVFKIINVSVCANESSTRNSDPFFFSSQKPKKPPPPTKNIGEKHFSHQFYRYRFLLDATNTKTVLQRKPVSLILTPNNASLSSVISY